MSLARRSRLGAAVFASLFALMAREAKAETVTLGQAIEMGLQKSPATKEARARVESADYTISSARAGYFPSVNLTVQAGYFDDISRFSQKVPLQNPTTGQITGEREVEGRRAANGTQIGPISRASITWRVFDFGKTSNNVGQAEANHRAAQSNEKETSLQISGQIANAYIGVYYQEKLFDLAKSTLESRERLFAIAKGLVKAGIQPPVEELRSQARFETAKRDQARAKAALEDARLGLAMILGYDPNASLRVTAPRLPKPPVENATAMKDAETKRPLVAQAESNVDRARDAESAATAQYFPNLSLVANGSYTHQLPSALVNPQTNRGLFAGAQVDWAFDVGIPARVDAARADLAAAEANLEQTKRDAKTEAARAAIQVRMGQTQLEHAKRAEEATGQARAVIEARYVRGLSNPLELIEAEDSDLSARVTRISTELDVTSAIVRLCVLTGRPLVEDGDKDKDKNDSLKENP